MSMNIYNTRWWPVQARVAAVELKELPQGHRLVGCVEDLRRSSDI